MQCRYLKYLTKKYLKKHNVRDWLRVIASNKDRRYASCKLPLSVLAVQEKSLRILLILQEEVYTDCGHCMICHAAAMCASRLSTFNLACLIGGSPPLLLRKDVDQCDLACRVYELRYFNIADNEGEDEE